jgi:hypothetical protein
VHRLGMKIDGGIAPEGEVEPGAEDVVLRRANLDEGVTTLVVLGTDPRRGVPIWALGRNGRDPPDGTDRADNCRPVPVAAKTFFRDNFALGVST